VEKEPRRPQLCTANRDLKRAEIHTTAQPYPNTGTIFPHVCTTNRDLKCAEIHLENPRRDCTCLQLPTNAQIKRKKCPPSPRRNAYMRIDSLSVWKMPVEMQSTRDAKTGLTSFDSLQCGSAVGAPHPWFASAAEILKPPHLAVLLRPPPRS
jgi:hypothetical protein